MKYFKILVIPLLLISVISISCERDDICPDSTPTTPRLIIDFLDTNNEDNNKNVVNLLIIGTGNENTLSVFVENDEINYNGTANLSTAYLPLKTDENTTQYSLIKDFSINDAGTPDDTSDDFAEGNEDIITINYSRKEVYVSRACGYKTIFENVTLTFEPDTDNWIKARQPLNDNQSIEDETTAHFSISH